MRKMTRRMVTAALCCLMAAGLAGCGANSVAGKTLYSVSAWSGAREAPGDVVRIVFDEGDGYHYTDASREDTGTWKDEDGDIVLTSSALGGVTTLDRRDDGSYGVAGEDDAFGTRYFLSEDDAQAYTDEFVSGAPGRVAKLLESAAFSGGDGGWKSQTRPEEIRFSDGEVTYTKGEYTQDGYFFHQGPDDGDWLASDHSGRYEVTVDKMMRDGISGDVPMYWGTLTVGGETTDYKLTMDDSGVQLVIGQVKFSASE